MYVGEAIALGTRDRQTADDHLLQPDNLWEVMETIGAAGAVSAVL